jgi:hypothetical protein
MGSATAPAQSARLVSRLTLELTAPSLVPPSSPEEGEGGHPICERTRLGGLAVLHQLQTVTVVFSDLIVGMNGAAEVSQATQFFLNALKPFVPLPVGNLIHGPIAFATPILLVQLMELSDLRPQTPDLILEDF